MPNAKRKKLSRSALCIQLQHPVLHAQRLPVIHPKTILLNFSIRFSIRYSGEYCFSSRIASSALALVKHLLQHNSNELHQWFGMMPSINPKIIHIIRSQAQLFSSLFFLIPTTQRIELQFSGEMTVYRNFPAYIPCRPHRYLVLPRKRLRR